MNISGHHLVLNSSMLPPFPEGSQSILFGLGCFWGAERLFWQLPGVISTAAGYAGGDTPNPTYEHVCSGMSNHAEVVLVVYDPSIISFNDLLATFWHSHDPTQGMRQGNDRGSQYRSAIYTTHPEQNAQAMASLQHYQEALTKAGLKTITTEIQINQTFYYAAEYHQQYLAKNPYGYCNLKGTGVKATTKG